MDKNKKDELLNHLVAINQLGKHIIEMMETNRRVNDEFEKKIIEAIQAVNGHYSRITMELMKEE